MNRFVLIRIILIPIELPATMGLLLLLRLTSDRVFVSQFLKSNLTRNGFASLVSNGSYSCFVIGIS